MVLEPAGSAASACSQVSIGTMQLCESPTSTLCGAAGDPMGARSPTDSPPGRCVVGVTWVLHDLVACLKRMSPVVDDSIELLVAAQRISDACGDGSVLHLAASFALATKLLSTQYRESPACPTPARPALPCPDSGLRSARPGRVFCAQA